MTRYVLGLDIGTTSVKSVLINADTGVCVKSVSKDTLATTNSPAKSIGGSEQDPERILSAVQLCIGRLSRDLLKDVVRIGISGQMHGVVLWNHEGLSSYNDHYDRYEISPGSGDEESGGHHHLNPAPSSDDSANGSTVISNVFTWQDNRCNPEFLSTLPKPKSHLRVSTGYGCATLFWLLRNNPPEYLDQFDCAGSVMDLIICIICGLSRPIMSYQVAASWGYFDPETASWNLDLLKSAGFPVHLLPKVAKPDEIAGYLSQPWYSIPSGTPVGPALGDMQCSVLSTITSRYDEAVMNISTSAQLSYVMPPNFQPQENSSDNLEYFPFFNGQYLAVAASLNGGNILMHFVKFLQDVTVELGVSVPQEKIWDRILTLGLESQPMSLTVTPTVHGERHNPDLKGSLLYICDTDINLPCVVRAICRGIITNLRNFLPPKRLREHGIMSIQGTGSALIRNQVLQEEIKQQFGMDLVVNNSADSAMGAAQAVLQAKWGDIST